MKNNKLLFAFLANGVLLIVGVLWLSLASQAFAQVACGGEQCPSNYCGSLQITTGGYLSVDQGGSNTNCDINCADADPGDPDLDIPAQCPNGSTSVSCTEISNDGSNVYGETTTTTVCFENSTQTGGSGCIGNNWCVVDCTTDASGCYRDTGTVWCCDTATSATPTPTPTPDPGGGGTGGGAVCGDGVCNGSEDCSSCATDCGSCAAGDYCGDGACNGSEDCSTCAADCGSCSAPAFCGDGSCNGFENCVDCAADCGACPSYFPWFQVWGGQLVAAADYGYAINSLIPSETVCVEPACRPYLSALDRAGSANSDGVALVGGGSISANGRISYRDPNVYAIGTSATRLQENYTFFYRQYSLGLSPSDDFSATAGDAQKPSTAQEAYFHSGDMTIQSPWAVAAGESYVIFVDGNLTISDPGGVAELITVDEGGFLAFIVSGDITISSNVGHATLSNTAGNVEGVYVADGTLTTVTNSGQDKRFVGEGTFVGWTDVDLQRDYNGGSDNNLYPAETFIYRPDFVTNTPDKMKRAQILWQETN